MGIAELVIGLAVLAAMVATALVVVYLLSRRR
jgi:hypothetical protein